MVKAKYITIGFFYGAALLAITMIIIYGSLDSRRTPIDLNPKLETEVYNACKRYANLDLSALAEACKIVGYQQ
jgi:hypothetical protein